MSINWTKERPNKPCIFLTRNNDITEPEERYKLWFLLRFKDTEGDYLYWLDSNGEEYYEDETANWNFDEFLIIEYLE